MDNIPTTFLAPFEVVQPHEVATRIKNDKKAKSAIEGDILPCLAGTLSDVTAIPATRIVNFALQDCCCPSPWHFETQTVIPKGEDATTFDQLRNLSCTNALSKILESYVLDRLRKETKLRNNQYGDIKGSGTNHFLIECWDKVL